jgi:hypothetical protein
MSAYDLYMGGLAGNTDNRMIPQNSPCEVLGYADHQRRRSYAVTRQLDFRPRVPFGGLDTPVDQKDYDWYQSLLAAGSDIQVGDFLNLIIITPHSRLEWVEVNVVIPRTGLVMTVLRRQDVCPGSPAESTIALTAASNSPLAVNAIGATEGIFFSTRVDSSLLETSYISLEVTAVPGSGDALAGLFVIAQAEAVDWGSYDFNGNA